MLCSPGDASPRSRLVPSIRHPSAGDPSPAGICSNSCLHLPRASGAEGLNLKPVGFFNQTRLLLDEKVKISTPATTDIV